MRILVTTTVVLLGALTGARADNGGSWCYRDFGSQRTNCSFYSARQCLIVAGTFGGICERNNPPPPMKEKRRMS